MSDNEFVSTTAPAVPQQTPENTTPPFEPAPSDPPLAEYVADAGYPKETDEIKAPPPKPKKKRVRLTRKQRAAKIAAGWNPPGPQPKNQSPGSTALTNTELDKALAELEVALSFKQTTNQADVLLKALVDKLVALENDPQYRSVWYHFFTHGGVFSGPKYNDELKDAVGYLIGIEHAKASVGKKS